MAAHPEQRLKNTLRQRMRRNDDTESRRVVQHGTLYAVRAHAKNNERLCLECALFVAFPSSSRSRGIRAHYGAAPPTPHGTEGALRKHYRLGEKPCDECKEVYKYTSPSRVKYRIRHESKYKFTRVMKKRPTEFYVYSSLQLMNTDPLSLPHAKQLKTQLNNFSAAYYHPLRIVAFHRLTRHSNNGQRVSGDMNVLELFE